MRKNKGITLIALIITIIVLLILAGIMMVIMASDNGLINRTLIAQEEHYKQSIREKLNLELINILNGDLINGIKTSKKQSFDEFKMLKEDSEYSEYINTSFTESLDESGYYHYYILHNGYQFEIEENENGRQEVVFVAKLTEMKPIIERINLTVENSQLKIKTIAIAYGDVEYEYKYSVNSTINKKIYGSTDTEELDLHQANETGTFTITVKAINRISASKIETCEKSQTIDISKIIFNANGGHYSDNSDSYDVFIEKGKDCLKDISFPTPVHDEDFSLKGWSEISESADDFLDEETLNNPVLDYEKTLYAKWNVDKVESINPTLQNTVATYDGNVHEITVVTAGTGGQTQYRTCNDNTSWEDNWSTTVPSLTNAGILYVQARIKGDSMHLDSTPTESKMIQINPKPVQVDSSDLNEISDGTAKAFSVNVIEPTSDYIVYYIEGTTELTSSNYTSGTTTNPTKTNAGTTIINWYVHSNNANYSDVSGSNTLTIVVLNPPTITVTSGTSGKNGWYLSDVNLSITGNSDCVSYSISGDSTVAEQTVSNGSTIEISTEGIHNIVAYTQNNNGNKSSATELQIKIDKTKPTIKWTSPEGNKSFSKSTPNPNAEVTRSVYFSDTGSGVMHVSPGGSNKTAPAKLSDFSQASSIYHYHWSTAQTSGTYTVRFGYWTGDKAQTSTYYCWAEDAAGNRQVTTYKTTINYSK